MEWWNDVCRDEGEMHTRLCCRVVSDIFSPLLPRRAVPSIIVSVALAKLISMIFK
jgi:hypothetical protein